MSTRRLTFEITFHSPVRVGRGRARTGVNDTVDPGVIVPGASLKGLMRAAAEDLLGNSQADLVAAVFGRTDKPSPWHWDDVRARPDDELDAIRTGARIRVDNDAATAVQGGLFYAEYRWPETARFTVAQFTALPAADLRSHDTMLWAAAQAVHSIGADRNRGFGWVDITRVAAPAHAGAAEPPGADLVDRVFALIGGAA